IKWVETETFEDDPGLLEEEMKKVDGVLLTPGFGSRGVEGMILSARYAIEKDIPFLGICFGCQLLFVAFARYVMGLHGANSTEVNPNTPHPVVDLLPEQKAIDEKGGTMRLGGHVVRVIKNTKLYEAYKKERIVERFRHRYHIIPEYAEKGKKYGLIISATDEKGRIINAIEIKNAKGIVGVQFHPEFKSRPNRPSPVYLEFIKEVIKHKKEKIKAREP
ncbi:MAG: gamma-glutamyl-gamma-aminobutyrate hydrolase family protein, partial [Thermoprotei archaeon]|nr:gamma-glutamyl-gamma-aminobutyrate hydrolase family protein [Thermoprotei archaeon]